MDGPFSTAAAGHRPAESALASLHYAYPTAVFIFYVVSSSVSVCSLWAAAETGPHPRRRLIQRLMLANILTYVAQFASVSALSIASGKWLGQQDGVISVLSCILVFGVQFAGLSDSEKPVWYPYIGSYILALAFEPALLALALVTRSPAASTWFSIVTITTVALRYVIIAAVVVVYFAWRQSRRTGGDSERTPLIQKDGDGTEPAEGGEETQNAAGYGSTTDGSADANQTTAAAADNPESPWQRREREAEDKMRKRLSENGNWFAYAKSFVVGSALPVPRVRGGDLTRRPRSSSPTSGPSTTGCCSCVLFSLESAFFSTMH